MVLSLNPIRDLKVIRHFYLNQSSACVSPTDVQCLQGQPENNQVYGQKPRVARFFLQNSLVNIDIGVMERACLENVVADLGLPTVCHVSVHFMEMSSLSGGSVDYGQQDSEGIRSLSKYADFVE